MLDFGTSILVQPSVWLFGSIVFLVVYFFMRPKKNLPPGPPCMPIIGTMLSHNVVLSKEELSRLAKIYGDIFRLQMLSKNLIVLCNYEAIKEAAITKPLAFADRLIGNGFMNRTLNPKNGGIIVRDFDMKCRNLRSVSLSIMRNLGAGRSTMEEKILEEAEALSTVFAESNGQAFNPWYKVTSAVTNVILHIMFNKRHDYGDEELHELIDNTGQFMSEIRLMGFFNRFPKARFLSPFQKNFENFVKVNKAIVDYLLKYARPLIFNFHPGQDSNFIDAYLDKNYNVEEGKSDVDEEEFIFLLRDFILGGTETTTSSLKWTLLHLANRPEIQEKLQAALDRVVGKNGPYRLADKIPYLDAVVWEVQRYDTIIPTAIPHAASTEQEIQGFTIPKNTVLLYNLNEVHNDKSTWADPENFRPERFLDENGDFVKHPNVIPFGIGKRACLGELLARQELYIFTATLFHRFKFLPPEGVNKIDETRNLSFTTVPKPFQIRAIPRN